MKVNVVALLAIIALPQALTRAPGPKDNITPGTVWADLMDCNSCKKIDDDTGSPHSVLADCSLVLRNTIWQKICFCATNPDKSNSGHQVISPNLLDFAQHSFRNAVLSSSQPP